MTAPSLSRMTSRQYVLLSWIRSVLQPRPRDAASRASRAAGTCPVSGVVKKSRSSVGRVVRCCATRAAPPASKKPALSGRAKNSLATSIWKAVSSSQPPAVAPTPGSPVSVTPRPRRRPGSPGSTPIGPFAEAPAHPRGRAAARRRRRPGCRPDVLPGARSRTREHGRRVTGG